MMAYPEGQASSTVFREIVSDELQKLGAYLEHPEASATSSAVWPQAWALHQGLRDNLCVEDGRGGGRSGRLADIWDNWCVGDVIQGSAENCAMVKEARPHGDSARIIIVSEPLAAGGRKIAVVKQRSQYKSLMEVLNHAVSSRLTLPYDPIVAPCIARTYRDLRNASKSDFESVGQNCIGRIANWQGDLDYFLTMEEAQSLVPEGSTISPKLEGLARKLVDKNEDAQDLYGLVMGHVTGKLSSEDIKLFLSSIDQEALERFSVYCTICLHKDLSPGNFMLRFKDSSITFVLIDTANSFPSFPEKLQLNNDGDNDGSENTYWYPTLLLLPPVLRPLSSSTREWLLRDLDADKLEALLNAGSSMMLNGGVLSTEARKAAKARLVAMQDRLCNQPDKCTVRGLAFAAVPHWERDLQEVLRRPDYRTMDHVMRGGDMLHFEASYMLWKAEYWVHRHKAWVTAGALALVTLAGGGIRWRRGHAIAA